MSISISSGAAAGGGGTAGVPAGNAPATTTEVANPFYGGDGPAQYAAYPSEDSAVLMVGVAGEVGPRLIVSPGWRGIVLADGTAEHPYDDATAPHASLRHDGGHLEILSVHGELRLIGDVVRVQGPLDASTATFSSVGLTDAFETAHELSSTADGELRLDNVPVTGPELTAIGALAPADDDVLQRKAGAWTNRTPAQLLTDLGISGPTYLSSFKWGVD